MMQTQTLLIIAAVAAAFGLSYLQYIFKAKTKRTYVYVLAFLRFISFLLVFVLLINPTITTKTQQTEKVVLPVLLDNSQSIKILDSAFTQTNWVTYFKQHKALNAKYNVQVYPFAKNIELETDSLSFAGRETQIAQAAITLKGLYKNSHHPVLLISDGNQTQGSDYVFAFSPNNTVYPVVVGDTAFVYDAQLTHAQTNKYVYLNNEFPIEVFGYVATQVPTTVNLVVTESGKVVYKKQIEITPNKNAIAEVIYLKAQAVGVKKYKVELQSKLPEKNIQNNSKVVAVEVIDQKTNVALLSNIMHPDLGTLKNAIEKNEHRKVSLLKPDQVQSLQAYDVVILYQPDAGFAKVWDEIEKKQLNYWLIGGLHTNYNWLNQKQKDFQFQFSNQKEAYAGQINPNFTVFEPPNLAFDALPGLDMPFGTFKPQTQQNTLLYLKIKGITTHLPLLTFTEVQNKQKKSYWFGENLWKWRIETADQNSYFDELINKIVQYLAIQQPKQNLLVDIDPIYNQNETIQVTAQYFNKNLEYDAQAVLEANLEQLTTNNKTKLVFTSATNQAILNLEGLDPGVYQIQVIEPKSKTQISKTFEVLAFNPEKQALQANKQQLQALANQFKTSLYYSQNIEAVIQDLLANSDYVPTQHESKTQKSLIDWRYILLLILICFTAEWFLRKYNGLK
ncbi:hypothetical protein K5I29_03700 [Flavobacterium agricola]|uniref:VWA domain-containing protein n=1 Tax=Flavobacterium agricola TaxID=2870839 RepID=A0ABY6M2N8_9FLAO|nr:hypothetical protein [Flavobacterium agricola]UYW02025.1 hypothetical protein K5I29_03700 [Flavobacterium agricola]